jgi:hypothetical protein
VTRLESSTPGQKAQRSIPDADAKHRQELAALRHADLVAVAGRINALHDKSYEAAHLAIKSMVECGKLLSEAKRKVDHGDWLPWVEANLKFGARQAQKYMRLADHACEIEANANSNSPLNIDNALKLLAKPKEIAEPAPSRPQTSITSIEPAHLIVADKRPFVVPQNMTRLEMRKAARIPAAQLAIALIKLDSELAHNLRDFLRCGYEELFFDELNKALDPDEAAA